MTERLTELLANLFSFDITADLLRRGEIDMIDPHLNVLQAQALELRRQRAPGIRVDTVLGTFWDHFAIRQGPGGHPALRKRLVRQAIAYGIDRARIAREAAALTLASAAASKPLDSVGPSTTASRISVCRGSGTLRCIANCCV